MSLRNYKRKRNFENTPEPGPRKSKRKGGLRFVVQRHDASHLHYDFRLEMDGVLKSWAVPKGPSMTAGQRRLAVMVEDHPLAYGKFYGEIPEGNYGAGVVDLWDEGTYAPMDEVAAGDEEKVLLQQLKKGNIKITIKGHHLQGSFALVRINDDEGKNWLLIKKKDEHHVSPYHIEKIPPIKKAGKSKWKSRGSSAAKEEPRQKKRRSRSDDREAPGPRSKKEETAVTGKALLTKAWPTLQQPMLAVLTPEITNDPQCIYEPKYDGYRAVTKIHNGKVEMVSRNAKSFNEVYSSVVKDFQKVEHTVVLDGEVVIENENGVSDFQLLQNYSKTRKGKLKYYVFDILYFENYVLTNMPLLQRKELLSAFFKKYSFANVFETPYTLENGSAAYNKYVNKGFEGVIKKELQSVYESGIRSDSWLKIKNVKMQEAIICGYTPPKNSRQYFGSLILGLYENGILTYIGNCGSGFTDVSLKELHAKFSKLKTPENPFTEKIPLLAAKGKPVWLNPVLVCNIKFQEWTSGGHMRIPVFAGLRTDKEPTEVIREDKMKKKLPVKPKKKAKASAAKNTRTKAAKVKTDKARTTAKSDDDEDGDRFIKIKGKEVKLTNLHKVYWPGEGITKGDVIAYYQRISNYILPYLQNRPQSLNRHPNGIKAPGFYQKDMDVAQLPDWAKTAKIFSKSNNEYIDYLICNDEATLLYMANLGCIEINPWHSRYGNPDFPDYMMLDLDPGNISFVNVVNTALIIKEICDEIKIECFCKTSGATGLHIYIPLGAKYTYDEVRVFAQWMAQVTHERLPDTTSVERSVSKRKNKIYVDFLQNSKGQTIASAYSVRPRPGATVSTPLLWKEVNHKLDPTEFTIFNIEKRLKKVGDLWKGVLGKGINLNNVLKQMKGVH